MKVTLFMAISLNGIIARENNEEDFLSDVNWKTLVELTHKTGCVIWGHKTHEIVRTWEKKYWDEIKDIRKVILGSSPIKNLEKDCIQATSPKDAIQKLTKENFKEILLSGGSTLNSSFLKEGLVDEIILNIEPAVIGGGIPVFKLENFDDVKLEILNMKRLEEDIVQLSYKVLN